jgi:hypothetical protein
VTLGVSNTELSASVVERYVGAPLPAQTARAGGAGAAAAANAPAARATGPAPQPAPAVIPCVGGVPQPVARGAGGGGRGAAAQPPEQQAAANAQAAAMLQWRTTVPMSKFVGVRKKIQ